jgi:hypothetical protein
LAGYSVEQDDPLTLIKFLSNALIAASRHSNGFDSYFTTLDAVDEAIPLPCVLVPDSPASPVDCVDDFPRLSNTDSLFWEHSEAAIKGRD